MPDLTAKIRAKFRRRTSGSTGTLSQESSAASSIAEPQQKSPLVSSGQSRHPPEVTATGHSENVVHAVETNQTNSRHLGNLVPVAKLESLKSNSKTQTLISAVDKTWKVGEEDEQVDDHSQKKPDSTPAQPDPASATAGALSKSATPASATKVASTPDGLLQASDMKGNDLRPPISRMPSINEDSATDTSDAGGPAETVAHANDSSSTTDDDDGILANPPLPSSENDTTPTPRVVPATPDPSTTTLRPPPVSRPSGPTRRQSLLPDRQTTLIRTLLSAAQADDIDLSAADLLLPINATMVTRKIWVRRPGASATLVTINEDDLVDDVREMILRKYGNTLGRQFDAPDLTLRIVPREKRLERTLGPEEPMSRTIDAYYPGGQSVDEALIIDVPLVRRTPKASPRTGPPHASHLTSVGGYYDEVRPSDANTDYFGPSVGSTAHMPVTVTAPSNPTSGAVLSTGQAPQIPSPGGTRSRNYRERPDRPRLGRQHTSSPTIIGGHPTTGMHDPSGSAPAPPAPPMPTPPADSEMAAAVPSMVPMQRAASPPPPTASPRPVANQMPSTGTARPRKKKTMDQTPPPPSLPTGMLSSGVPPINVLIVEDNIINLKLLEAFVKRLKVRWQTAMNGRDAVTKWRTGGFHLVLMDIQLPIMNGLEATREIRRLERVNSIGVLSGPASSASAAGGTAPANGEKGEPAAEDKLVNMEVFKSPVIIVALTASSLQSDRHEALTAGCNDFLTKPVNFVWLERKVMEWGCMQALIDFDGWRKWKDFSLKADEAEAARKSAKGKKSKNRLSTTVSSSAT